MAKWGEKDWFKALYHYQGTSKPSAYFAHHKNGYQKYRHRLLIRFFSEHIPGKLAKQSSFIDIGCATGDFAHALLKLTDFEVGYGIDFLDEAISVATERYPTLSFKIATLPDIPLPDNCCDLVVASEVLYYLDELDREAVIDSAVRILRGDGHILFSAALGSNYMTPDEARSLLRPQFEIIAETYDYVRFYHRFISPFDRLHRLNEIMHNPKLYKNGRLHKLVNRHFLLFRNPLSLTLMNIAARLTSVLFAWRWIPAFFAQTSKMLDAEKARSNIVILARLKSNS